MIKGHKLELCFQISHFNWNKVTACYSKKNKYFFAENRDTGCKEIKSVTPSEILSKEKKKTKTPKNMNSSQIPRGKIDAETLQCPKLWTCGWDDVDEVNSYNQEPGTQNEVEVLF